MFSMPLPNCIYCITTRLYMQVFAVLQVVSIQETSILGQHLCGYCPMFSFCECIWVSGFFMKWQLYTFRVKVCQNIFVMLFLTEVILAKLPNLANWHVLWILPHITYIQVTVPTLAVQGQHKCRITWVFFAYNFFFATFILIYFSVLC